MTDNITSGFRRFAEGQMGPEGESCGEIGSERYSQRHIRSISGWESVQGYLPRTFVGGGGEPTTSRNSPSTLLRGDEMVWSDGVRTWKVSLRQHRRDPFCVYVAWGRDRSRPLYVGKANNVMHRIGQHLAYSKWRRSVQVFDVYAFASEREALAAETRAIHELNPKHNVRRFEPPLESVDAIGHEQMQVVANVQNRRRKAGDALVRDGVRTA